MKLKKIKLLNFLSWFLCVFLVFICTESIYVLKAQTTDFPVPAADTTYTEDWGGTLVINENKTIKISNIKHDNTENNYNGSAIKICGNATVNLVFEGSNILSGNTSAVSAGIEIENGATVNIYGLEESSLRVTGGEYSAAIGGLGYGSVSATNPNCGNINIYSGNITCIGGDKGAGIGSGYHSSASDINIKGGNIIALSTGGGAGIGTGYGTSGGAATAAGVGFYNGGNITISGGIVKAAAYHINFDNFDQYNTESLYGEGYSDTFAAGIGGGYGASSGNIIIEGNADVTAIGSCGGAGIGSGRGTSKSQNYDAENFDVNIIIRGNSKVVAMATDDRRSSVIGDDGGAAIGLGRGCTSEGELKGSIVIEGNANVFAVAPDHAQAIGGSSVVGKYTQDGDIINRPPNATVKNVNIGNATIVLAVSDGYRNAIAQTPGSTLSNFILLNFDENYFEKRSDFFTEDKFPVKTEVFNAQNNNLKTMFSMQNPSKMNIMVHILNTNQYNFVVKDYQGSDGESIFLSNDLEENSAQFIGDPSKVKEYDATGLTAKLYKASQLDSKYGNLKLKIEAKEGIFEYGSAFFCDKIEDQEIIDNLNSKLDQTYADKLERILYFDIGVKNILGEKYSTFKGGNARIYIEVPENWDNEEIIALFVKSEDDEIFKNTQRLDVIDGITYLSFETNHFSNYAIFDPVEINEINNPQDTEDDLNTADLFKTGDDSYTNCIIWGLIALLSLFMILILSKQKGRHFINN